MIIFLRECLEANSKKFFGPTFRLRSLSYAETSCVGPLFQLLGILQYACGLKLGPALSLNQNPLFEMASGK
jgi:hypothetical protein